MSDVVELLGKAKLFGAMPLDQRQKVAQQMRPASYRNGQQIFSRGDAGTELDGLRRRLPGELAGDGAELAHRSGQRPRAARALHHQPGEHRHGDERDGDDRRA